MSGRVYKPLPSGDAVSQHRHATIVPGCFRCELGEDERHPLPWRQGRSVGRTLYDANDVLIGVMDTRELAARVVAAMEVVKDV